jgi:hypothetical protein
MQVYFVHNVSKWQKAMSEMRRIAPKRNLLIRLDVKRTFFASYVTKLSLPWNFWKGTQKLMQS